MEAPITISFRENKFNYIVSYSPSNNMTNIECTHIEEYYVWQSTIADDIYTNEDELKKSYIAIKLTPKMIFDLIHSHVDRKLNPIYSFKFPEKIKAPTSQLMIELITKLPMYDEHEDIKVFFLQPLTISDSDRFNNKFLNLEDKNIKQMQLLHNENDELRREQAKLYELINESKQIIHLLTQTMQTLATKAELSNLATKQELGSYIAKTELANLVTKQELAALDNKFAPKV